MTYQGSSENHEVFLDNHNLNEGFSVRGVSSMRLSGKKLIILSVILAGLLTWVLGRNLLKKLSSAEVSPAINGAPTATKSVRIQTPQSMAIRQALTATGTVIAYDLVQVSPQLNGLTVRSVLVQPGDVVAQDQVLAVLDDASLRAQMSQAEANLAQAQAQVHQQRASLAQAKANLAEAEDSLRRYQALFAQGAISQEQLASRQTQVITTQELVQAAIANIASATANVASKEADIAGLQLQLAQTQIQAPADGIIADRQATVGSISTTGTPLFNLIRGDVLELEVNILQNQLDQIAVGSPVKVSSISDDSFQLQGAIRTIEPIVDAQSRQATVKIRLPDSNALRPGMFLKAEIMTGERQGLVVPTTAVIFQANSQPLVYTLTPEGNVEAAPVETGERLPATDNFPASIEILSGLNRTSQIVVEGAAYLQDGEFVKVSENIISR